MNGFLVLANTAMDDIPMGLFTVEEVAVKILRRDVTPELVECISVMQFSFGVPISCDVVNNFGDE